MNVPINSWQHVAVTYKNNVATFYINGVKEVVSGFSSNNISGNENLGIGYSSIYGNYFAGQMDEIRIWNIALSDIDIVQNKNKIVIPF